MTQSPITPKGKTAMWVKPFFLAISLPHTFFLLTFFLCVKLNVSISYIYLQPKKMPITPKIMKFFSKNICL